MCKKNPVGQFITRLKFNITPVIAVSDTYPKGCQNTTFARGKETRMPARPAGVRKGREKPEFKQLFGLFTCSSGNHSPI
jgi:hypothetical protein